MVKKLKSQTPSAISYCVDLLSFVFQHPDASVIQSIYLYGSAMRGQLHPQSDIDLFIECKQKDEKRTQQVFDSGVVKFTSSKDYQKWKLFHFLYPFSIQVGQLAEWDLKLSIASEGLLLYSQKPIIPTGERKVLFTITLPKKKKEYIKVRRVLFGRDEEFYRNTGLLRCWKGQKLSSTVFIVPQEEQRRVIDTLSKEKINFSMKEIISLES